MIHKIVITYNDENFEFGVEGAPSNLVLSYGILSLAMAAIQERAAKNRESKVVEAHGPLPPFRS